MPLSAVSRQCLFCGKESIIRGILLGNQKAYLTKLVQNCGLSCRHRGKMRDSGDEPLHDRIVKALHFPEEVAASFSRKVRIH